LDKRAASVACHQPAATNSHMLTDNKNGDVIKLLTSKAAANKVRPEGVSNCLKFRVSNDCMLG
jgi:hypothetical protein